MNPEKISLKARIKIWLMVKREYIKNYIRAERRELIDWRTAWKYRKARKAAIEAVTERREWGMSLPAVLPIQSAVSNDRYDREEERY